MSEEIQNEDGSTVTEDGSPREVDPSSTPKRRGRPPGSKNRPKESAPEPEKEEEPAPAPKLERQLSVCSVHGQYCPGHKKG